MLFSVDTEGTITYISPQVTRYGYSCGELVNRPFAPLIHPEDRDRILETFSSEMMAGVGISSTFRILDRRGSAHWVEELGNAMYDENKELRGLQGVLRDITDRKKAEDAIQLANKILNLLNDITRHDIINTLTGLLWSVAMAQDPALRDQLPAILKDIEKLARDIQKQIEFTREYQAVGIREPVWHDIRKIITSAAGPYSGSGVRIVNDISSIEVFADPLLEKVIYNLIQNAVSYGKRTSVIRFTERMSDRGFAIVCDDDGAGVPVAMKEKIFERGVGQHTGMGLFLSREVLNITGITIRENGTPGKGARFEMVVPKGGYRFHQSGENG